MLGNSIGLLTLALMLASEGRRAEGHWRPGLYTLAVIVTLIAFALQPIAKELPAVGTGLSAIFGNPLAWFMLLLGLFFVLRPFWQPNPARTVPLDLARVDHEAKLLGPMVARLEKLEGLETRLNEAIQVVLAKVQTNDLQLDRELDALRSGQSLTNDQWREQIISLYDSLAAIYHRERLFVLADEIEAFASVLEAPTTKSATYDAEAWERWEREEDAWRDRLNRWVELADCYKPGTGAAINYTPEDNYKMGWSIKDEQFPNSTAIYAYKTFRIRLRNWQDRRGDVEKAVHGIAFNGGTAASRPISVSNALSTLRDGQGPG